MKKTSFFFATIAFVAILSTSCCGDCKKSENKECGTECSTETKAKQSCCSSENEKGCAEKTECSKKAESKCCAAE